MEIFNETLRTILRHNVALQTFELGINQFADMTFEEFAAMNSVNYSIAKVPEIVPFNPIMKQHEPSGELPASFDWRDFGSVSGVKDQKSCGSCYALSAMSAIESLLHIKTGKMIDLSVQEIIDCAGDFETWGCYGGFDHRVIDYVLEKGGVSLADDYSYEEKQGKCRKSDYQQVEFALKGYGGVKPYDEDELKKAVATVGPIAISLDINHESFMRYSNGIYQEEDCDYITNHAALLVGYGSEDAVDYWIVKNSFGTTWGEFGYIRIVRNSNNDCGITKHPLYPIIE